MNDFKPESINWKPASHEGANFCTYRLAVTNDKQLAFKPTLLYRTFALVFLGAGIWLLNFLIYGEPTYRNGMQGKWADVVPFGLGIFFIGGGIWMVFSQLNGITFSATSRTIKTKKETINFSDVAAIQLLKKIKRLTRTNGGSARYYTYEMNIVKNNNSRVFLVAHSDRKTIEKDARLISRYIDKEIHSNI